MIPGGSWRSKRSALRASRTSAARSKSRIGGSLNTTVTVSRDTAIAFPVRRKIGTPAHRHESISTRAATNVSTVESGATPGSSR